MPGKIIRCDRVMRQTLQRCPQHLFVFGDNGQQRGLGGQAREMRGEPNAVGIPTKHAPSMRPSAFFTDGDLPAAQVPIDAAFARLAAHLEAGGTVVWPAAGVGTGLAQLAERAPAIRAYIDEKFEELRRIAARRPS